LKPGTDLDDSFSSIICSNCHTAESSAYESSFTPESLEIYGDKGLITFGVTGNMLLCCTDLNEECILGNILTNTKNEMLAKRNEVYTKILSGSWQTLRPCNRCLTKAE
jgi:hypothetical protein